MGLSETPVADLKPYKQNARTHSPEQVRQIVKSIEQFGFTNPVLTDGKNRIVAGHGRVMAAKEMGLPTVPTIPLSHLTKAQVRAYVIADNKLALNAGWDEQLLAEELKGIDDSEIDIDLTGFSEDEIAELLKEEPTGSSEDDDNVPDTPQNIFNVQRGQIWQLGEHRIMCGDSTDKGDVDRLMDGAKADMVFTDPPYGIDARTDKVEYVKTFKNQGVAAKGRYAKIAGDDSTETAIKAIAVARDLNAPCNIFWGGNYYDLKPSPCWIVWDKRVEERQTNILNSDCELAYVDHKSKASVRIFRHLWKGMIKASESGEPRVHPTQKPVALAEWCFENYGDPKTILDLFLGSGSTLIACEKTGRKCYGMEIDPHYCSVIINRWQEYTGKTAEPVDGS
jgi:DNA modification methylase